MTPTPPLWHGVWERLQGDPHSPPGYSQRRFRSAPCRNRQPCSAQRGKIPGSATGSGPGVQPGREAAAPGARRVGPAVSPPVPPGSRLPNQGAARARAAANQERRERLPEPVGAERARSRDPAAAPRSGGSAPRAVRPGWTGEPRAGPAGFAAATFRPTLGTQRAASQVTALRGGRASVWARAGPLRWSGQGAGRGRAGREVLAPRVLPASLLPAACFRQEPGESRHFHTPRASRSGRRGGESV